MNRTSTLTRQAAEEIVLFFSLRDAGGALPFLPLALALSLCVNAPQRGHLPAVRQPRFGAAAENKRAQTENGSKHAGG